MIESTNPTVAMVLRETERRPMTDVIIPAKAIGTPQKGVRILMIPRMRPASARPRPGSDGATGTP